jgi:hypothetical protein
VDSCHLLVSRIFRQRTRRTKDIYSFCARGDELNNLNLRYYYQRLLVSPVRQIKRG